VILTAIGGGCTTWSGARVGFRSPKSTFKESDKESPAEQSEPIAASERSSKSPSKAPPESAAEKGSSSKTTPPKPLSGKIADKTPNRPPLDSATEVLIENELKDATPAEQEQWLARFETMSAREITAALAERRSALAAEFDRRHPRMPEAPDPNGDSSFADSEPPRNSVELAAGTRAAPRNRADRSRGSDWDELVQDPQQTDPPAEPRETHTGEVDIWGDPVPPPSRNRSADKLAREQPDAETVAASYSELPAPGGRESLVRTAEAVPPHESDSLPQAPVETPETPSPPAGAHSAVSSRTSPAGASASATPPRIEPARPSRLSDWDPTKLFTRRKPAEHAAAAAESPPQEAAVPPEYRPRSAHSLGPTAPPVETPVEGRRIDPQASYTTDEVRRLISLMEAETQAAIPGASPELQREYLRRHVNLRLLRLVANEREAAQEPIPGLDPIDQEFWNSVFWGMANYFDDSRVSDPTERAAITAAQFQAAARHLQTTAKLELKNVAFCHRIDGFGSFERFQRDEFQAGVPVLIYAEVRNFGSEPTVDGQYRTILRSSVEIVRVGAQNAVADRMSFDPTEDRSRSQRTDFYNSYKINLPPNLSPGPYLLRLTVEDETTGKIATQALNFSIR